MRRAVKMSFRDGAVRANSRAQALPMPLLAPVMRIVFPERREDVDILNVIRRGRVVVGVGLRSVWRVVRVRSRFM